MARKAKAMAAQRAGGGRKANQASTARLFMTVALLALIPFSLPTMLLMFAGMLPTLVAALTDRSNSRYAWICVGGLNFAGLCPAVLTLWFGHHEITYALHQVTSVRVMLLAYLAAACGWALYFIAPPIVLTIMAATSKRRAGILHAQLKKLEEEWGSEVQSKAALSAAADDIDL
jgi:hypothetical protein